MHDFLDYSVLNWDLLGEQELTEWKESSRGNSMCKHPEAVQALARWRAEERSEQETD